MIEVHLCDLLEQLDPDLAEDRATPFHTKFPAFYPQMSTSFSSINHNMWCKSLACQGFCGPLNWSLSLSHPNSASEFPPRKFQTSIRKIEYKYVFLLTKFTDPCVITLFTRSFPATLACFKPFMLLSVVLSHPLFTSSPCPSTSFNDIQMMSFFPTELWRW